MAHRYDAGKVTTYRERDGMVTQPPGKRWHVTSAGTVFENVDDGPWRRSKHSAYDIGVFAKVFLVEV